jgi:hypothetical protein
MKRMSDTAFVRIEPELKATLAEVGEEEERPLSYMIRLAIIEFLDARGRLPGQFKTPKSPDKRSRKAPPQP